MSISTKIQNGIAKGLQEYINPAKLAPLKKPVRTQMMEMDGLQEFDKGLYHNRDYENLIKYLVTSRKQFKQSTDQLERKNLAKQEFSEWKKYIEVRKTQLTEDFQIPDYFKTQFNEAWQLVKNRKESILSPQKVLEFHYELMKSYKFQVPIEPHLLVQMIHPHQGYLSHYPGSFSQQDLMNIYYYKLVASMERSLGQDLLANEISAFTYWNLYDKDEEGSFDLQKFAEFMKTFRFNLNGSLSDFQKQFKFGLSLNQGEISRDLQEQEQVIRFDFYRYIFLERNL
ncbi:leucine rich repeat protein [Ichthyophthirius multifiliis]|uniref:Leucine rich repeat protein n=1 Tax=Ichthyophthirius multifiliis TaxID=5932 RepID=G0QRT2_ICHMU|nr:leucine rich repeat protein [Ichthyophthirius multifiliis]EGR32066.1 leucine rich repeat protein [Ichthyophthirius multifiliis]|eukprot:XP_004035552.1 leucine rich repeat protein [Ichthyophthirius multifiliis]